MRPVKLTMTAFGPYAGTEVVDFREATDAGLFGIYGPTGSGKSSIFSAMTFALFGEGAKREQSITTMRSGHADADRMTEVSLLFELGDKRYYVRRQPDQARPKKRGEGQTVEAHKAWLFDVTGIEVDAVTPDNCGVVLAEEKVTVVETLVKALLGYGVEQFRQIVLLPQGRFERFLISDSDKRIEILRELFDVSLYKRIAKRMHEASVVVRRDFDDGHRIIGRRLGDVGFASTDELATGIEMATAAVGVAQGEAEMADTAAGDAEKSFLAAEALEARFVAHKDAVERKSRLEGERPSIEQAEIRKSRAERAQRAMDLEAGVSGAVKLHGEAQEAETSARDLAAKAQTAFGKSEAVLTTERGRSGEIEELLTRASDAERYRRSLEDGADLRSKWEKLDGDRDAAQLKFEKMEAEHKRLEALGDTLSTSIDQARKDGLRRAEFSSSINALTSQLNDAQAYAAAAKKLDDAISECNRLEEERDRAVERVEPSRQQAEAAERAFISAHAQLLASTHLVEGQPCPVCGSVDHPEPVHGDGDPKGLEQAMRSARSALDAATSKAVNAEALARSADALVADRRQALAELIQPVRMADEIDETLKQAKADLAALGKVEDLAGLEAHADDTKRLLGDALTSLNSDRSAAQEARTAAAVAARSYQDEIAGVPELMRVDGALDEEVRTVADAIQDRRDALSVAEKAYMAAAADRDTKAAKVTSAVENVAATQERVEAARAAFEARLVELDLSADDYRRGRGDVREIASLGQRIQAFRDGLAKASAEVDTAALAIAEREQPNMDAYRILRDAAKIEAIRLRGLASDAEAHRKVLDDLRASLATELERLEKLEQETGALRALALAFNGDNQMRIPLETFAIGAMFDHVLEAANLRLHPMTAGRYRFERDAEAIGGRTKRGLDIRVHDIETGRPREISTLSGGETFIAALSLALGLSDIVEMSHGSIRLDTIFIDEGFGSLDTENDSGTLDRVLVVLQEIVGKSRAVGLISHVPLVQQAVPNGFSIVKGVGGSSIERRVA
ncbi:AAA family ATPase [Sphingobium yanoikuyae]|jgi:exonuclease SbcC|uniref:AAA family ATPase n=1 Tax=Sphingobium yanoikuyae TaxID=13690 RepID=UPI0035C8122B